MQKKTEDLYIEVSYCTRVNSTCPKHNEYYKITEFTEIDNPGEGKVIKPTTDFNDPRLNYRLIKQSDCSKNWKLKYVCNSEAKYKAKIVPHTIIDSDVIHPKTEKKIINVLGYL
jgi:hypothetical protein